MAQQNINKHLQMADGQRQVFPMEGTPDAGGAGFEIMCMTAGEGNGWIFSPEVLQAAVPLFEGVQCFIDHMPIDSMDGHSVRDLAGIITDVIWDETAQGIKGKLTPMGAGAEILSETAKEVLALEGIDSKVGFSADLGFNNEGSTVTEIVKIYSVDFVIDPARGGAVLRALNSIRQRQAAEQMRGQMASDVSAMRGLQATNTRLSALAAEAAQSKALRASMCKTVLDASLSQCGLPTPVKDRIRKSFTNRLFDPQELNEAIEDGAKLTSELMSGQSVSGVSGKFSGMYNSQDQLNAAVHDLLGAKRPDGVRNVKCQRLQGIRELYLMMTGDFDFHGGYDSKRAQFATTADLPGILKNALNKLIAQRWDELGASGYRWWEPVVTVEHFENLQDVTGILVGELNLLPSVNEGAAYTALGVADSPEVSSWNKYGAYIPLTIEMFERDDTMRLRQYPFKLATAGLRRISALVGSIFTANSGVGPAMADTYHVFELAHHANLGTGALSSANWEAACQSIWNQNMLAPSGATAPKLAVDGRYCIVPRQLRLAAQKILYPSLAYEANITSENMQRGQFGDVITCPEMSDATDWACVADPAVAPAIYIGERFGLMPEIYIADNQLTGALFTNDEIRVKARHFLNVMVADYRPMYKANVADV